jgi:hypothetical protein
MSQNLASIKKNLRRRRLPDGQPHRPCGAGRYALSGRPHNLLWVKTLFRHNQTPFKPDISQNAWFKSLGQVTGGCSTKLYRNSVRYSFVPSPLNLSQTLNCPLNID